MAQFKQDYSVMFVDVVDSTALKYKEKEEDVAKLMAKLFSLINKSSQDGRDGISFLGDGAMVIFNNYDKNGCKNALVAAENILQAIDAKNISDIVQTHIRIGIATEKCYVISKFAQVEISGKVADLSARLCSNAELNSILIDKNTKEQSEIPDHHFKQCKKRLQLKGVPPSHESINETFYYYRAERLINPLKEDYYSKGLLTLYPDRTSLSRDLRPARIIWLAAKNSTVLVSGRTLISWTRLTNEMKFAAKEKNIKFHFLIGSRSSNKYLDENQKEEIKKDLPKAKEYFTDLVRNDKKHFELHETDQLILDGVTCSEIVLPSSNDKKRKLMVLQDINAAPGDAKAALLLACKCKKPSQPDASCMAHGIHERTERLFNSNYSKPIDSPPLSTPQELILSKLRESNEGLSSRNNHIESYIHRLPSYFKSIKNQKLDKIPAPMCVQVQVASKCSTQCEMCDHSKNKKNELNSDEWKKVFRNLSEFGVGSLIFSGGEPLTREDLADLLKSASDKNLKIGLLTNGTFLDPYPGSKSAIIEAISRYADWVAVSIDSIPGEGNSVRTPNMEKRIEGLKEFCKGIEDKEKISATVTLQKLNVNMNLKKTIKFIHDLGIPSVNFKLATGSKKALDKEPTYLLSKNNIKDLNNFLWNNRLADKPGNNLDYLRRCFAGGIFDPESTSTGAPLRSFYESDNIRCFTPFLFSLIDNNGDVYPCCHLYRDNHLTDSTSKIYRETHKLGNIKDNNFKFEEIWNSQQYVNIRKSLEKIDLTDRDFYPCGECTRYCQHNSVLTNIYSEYRKSPKKFLDIISKEYKLSTKPVWF